MPDAPTTPPVQVLASVTLTVAAESLEREGRAVAVQGDRDNPAEGVRRLRVMSYLADLLRAEAGAARMTEAMFAASPDDPTLIALLHQTYPENVRAAVRLASVLLEEGSAGT